MTNIVLAIAIMCQTHAPSTGQDRQLDCSQKLLKCYLRSEPARVILTEYQENEKLLACIDTYRGKK